MKFIFLPTYDTSYPCREKLALMPPGPCTMSLPEESKNAISFVEKGVQQGRRKDLTGGGLLRSAGGWLNVKMLREAKIFYKSDERILGDSDFVESVLAAAGEQMERKYALQAAGLDLDGLAKIVARLTGVKPSRIFSPGKDRSRVYARSLLCFWAVRQLGISMAELSRRTRISQSSISKSVQRGEQIVEKEGYSLLNELKLENRRASPLFTNQDLTPNRVFNFKDHKLLYLVMHDKNLNNSRFDLRYRMERCKNEL